MDPISHYEFQHLFLLDKIGPTNFGGRNHLVSEVQRIREKDRSTPNTTDS